MRSLVVVALICASAPFRCGGTDEVDPSTDEPTPESPVVMPAEAPASAGPPVGAWVVIDEHGMFETASAEPKRILPNETASQQPRVWIAEVLSLAGEFIEVRTIKTFHDVCASSLGVESDYELRFFIRPEALLPVLVRPVQSELDDGTKLELVPGVRVLETGPKGKVQVGEVSLSVAVDAADVGRWFVASPSEPLLAPLLAQLWDRDLELHYGEHTFRSDLDPFTTANEQHTVEGKQLLTFVNACGRFVLRAEPKAGSAKPGVAKGQGGVLGVMVRESCVPLQWVAPRGTKLSWPSGGEAGTVLVPHILRSDAEERGDQVCFEVSDLGVCIETAKLEREGDVDCKPNPALDRQRALEQFEKAKQYAPPG